MDAGMREEDHHRKQNLTHMLEKLHMDFAGKIAHAERIMATQALEVKEPVVAPNFEFQGRDLTRHDGASARQHCPSPHTRRANPCERWLGVQRGWRTPVTLLFRKCKNLGWAPKGAP